MLDFNSARYCIDDSYLLFIENYLPQTITFRASSSIMITRVTYYYSYSPGIPSKNRYLQLCFFHLRKQIKYKYFSKSNISAPMSFKGLNYGKLDFQGQSLSLTNTAGTHPIMNLKYKDITNSTMNKNDIIIETYADEVGNEDCICEIRFHVELPKDQENQMDVQGAKEKEEEDVEGQEKEQKASKTSYAKDAYQKIVSLAKIGNFGGESIATLYDVNLVAPRGKYTLDFYHKTLRFHGSTFNYIVQYKNITKGFILPMMNESQVSIVLQLNKDKPIYHGQTVYRYIIIQIKKQIEVEIKTRVTPEIIQKAPQMKDLQAEYNSPMFEVLVELIRTAAGINLVQPGNNFRSKVSQPCLKCNVKTQGGYLYMLKQSIIFIPKPILYFRMEEIASVQICRVGTTNKVCDVKINIREEKKSVQFAGIQREEVDALAEYFKARNVKVIMELEQTSKIITAELDSDESEDEDFEAGEDDDDDSLSNDELGSQEESQSHNKKKEKPRKDKRRGQEGSKEEKHQKVKEQSQHQ